MPKAKSKGNSSTQAKAATPSRPPILLPEVFILESLRLQDEREHKYEGRALSDMLYLSGKRPIYHYFAHENELPHLINLFKLSKYRFLHFSCHGETDRIFTTYEEIPAYRLARHLRGSLATRRLFFSACKVGNKTFSEIIGQLNTGVQSIVGPVEDIQFDHAAAIWNALYVSLFAENSEGMTHDGILARLQSLAQLFPIDLHLSAYHPHDRTNPWNHQVVETKMRRPEEIQAPAIPTSQRVKSYLTKSRSRAGV